MWQDILCKNYMKSKRYKENLETLNSGRDL
jgi:hypothetical protein